MDKRRITIIVGVLLGVLVLLIIAMVVLGGRQQSAEEEGDAGPVTIRYWRVFDDKDKFQPLIDKYQADHPDVKIEYRKLTYEEYERTLVDALAGGRGPDIFTVHNTWLPRYFDKIEPIPTEKYALRDYRNEFYPPAFETIRNDRIYGIPLAIDSLGLYLNAQFDLDAGISQAPRTWEDLVGEPGNPDRPGILRALSQRQGDRFTRSAIALGNNTVSRSVDILALMMLQQRTQMTNDDNTQATFNLTQDVEGRQQPLGRLALEFYTSFADPRSNNYSWNSKSGDSVRAFAEGKVAYMVGYAYHAPEIERLNPELQYEIAPMLQIAGTSPVNYASFWVETVARGSEHPEEAWNFLRFITNRDNMPEYTQAVESVPARKEVPASGGLEVLQDQLETARSWYKGDAAKADAIFARMIDQVLAGENPQNVIDRGANELTDILRGINASAQ